MARPQRVITALLALAAMALAPGCYVLMPFALALDPAPVLDVVESPELLDEAQGTLVAPDGSRELLVISFPGGEERRIPTGGRAIAASALDAEGRLVYVRMERPWWKLGIGERDYTLVLKSVASGAERELGRIATTKHDDPTEFSLGLVGKRALCSFRGRRPRVFELGTGGEVDLSWWEESIEALSLTAEGTVIAQVSATPFYDELVEIDLDSRRSTLLPAGVRPEVWDLKGRRTELGAALTQSGTPWSMPPGWMELPTVHVGDRLVIHHGVASPASKPRRGSGLTVGSFEHSIRIADLPTGRTATLVPRVRGDTFAFSPFPLPSREDSSVSQ